LRFYLPKDINGLAFKCLKVFVSRHRSGLWAILNVKLLLILSRCIKLRKYQRFFPRLYRQQPASSP
jgi:hypothetical protein